MTPEERAKEIRDALPWQMTYEDWNQLEIDIAAAIREAVEDERGRLALECEQLTARRAAEMGLAHHDHLTGYQCAQAIRAHGTSSIDA